MSELGNNIAELRKKANMTQADLGEKLNISPQAISKWEKGLSEPDSETIKKLSLIFNVSIDYLFNNAEIKENVTEKEEVEQKEETEKKDSEPVRQPIAFCDACKKPLYVVNEYKTVPDKTKTKYYTSGRHTTSETVVLSTKILCNNCAKEKELKETYDKKKANYDIETKDFSKSWKWGIFAGIVAFLVVMIVGLSINNYLVAFLCAAVVAYGAFAITVQLFWDGIIVDILGFFVHSFSLPGIIFEFSLDGFIALIVLKIVLSAAAGILSALIFAVGLVISTVIAMFMFPFQIGKQKTFLKIQERELNRIKKEYVELKSSAKKVA